MPDPLDKKPPIISRWGPDPAELFYDIPDAAPDPQAERIKALEAELESRKLVLLTDDWEQVRLKAQQCDAAEAENQALKEALTEIQRVAARIITFRQNRLGTAMNVDWVKKVCDAALAQAAPKST